ncbi:MAG TPA: ISKra4 family transposase [Verrucomicrobiae bacterium]|nr:ISKra4 family transposase [Verrucomicrobiae bacterium]
MEAVELGLREALLKDGRRLLEDLYSQSGLRFPDQAGKPGEKCHPQRPKEIHSLFGRLRLKRDYFYDPQSGTGRFPLDEALGLVRSFSPAMVRLAARAAAKEGYESASEDLLAQAGVNLSGRQIQRLVNLVAAPVGRQLEAGPAPGQEPIPVFYAEVDGSGVPMVAEELAGRAGKQTDGSAKTREVKLGAIFTQTKTDEEGLPVRDHASTTYVGSFETSVDFGARVRQEARRRGLGRAAKVVFIGDGAAWVWELARVNFPTAIFILDLYHALERLHELCEGLYGAKSHWAAKQMTTWTAMLKNDQIAAVIAAARRRWRDLGLPENDPVDKQIAYFETHRDKMHYKTYRDRGLFYGSGVVEGGCKSVIGQRLKESGMFWTERGATSVLQLRLALKSNRWDECWNRLHNSNYLKTLIAARN